MIVNGQDFSNHKWKNRILIVKTNDSSSSDYIDQLREFENAQDEMADRKLVLYKIVGSEYTYVDHAGKSDEVPVDVSGYVVEKILNDKEDFEVILIGLDGSVKRQQTEIMTHQLLFDTIDSMPMRQSEMRRSDKE